MLLIVVVGTDGGIRHTRAGHCQKEVVGVGLGNNLQLAGAGSVWVLQVLTNEITQLLYTLCQEEAVVNFGSTGRGHTVWSPPRLYPTYN